MENLLGDDVLRGPAIRDARVQKGYRLLGWVGIFFPILWLIGAVLPPKPGSPRGRQRRQRRGPGRTMRAPELGFERRFSSQLTLGCVRPSLPGVTTVSREIREVKGIIDRKSAICAFS